jgi:hypothetical protein
VIAYGRGGNNLLLRKAFVLDDSMSAAADHIKMDFSDLQKMSLAEMSTEAGQHTIGTAPTFPPKNVGHIEKLWPVIAPDISNLTIQAGKRMLDGTISWDVNGDGTAANPGWRQEFSDETGTLWTRHNQNDWPDLIKIKITIADEKLAELMDRDGPDSVTYEIICPIR